MLLMMLTFILFSVFIVRSVYLVWVNFDDQCRSVFVLCVLFYGICISFVYSGYIMLCVYVYCTIYIISVLCHSTVH